MAGILSRFKTIMESNINELLDKMEDPEKIINQTLRDLREDLAQVKKETASVMANENATKRELDAANEKIKKLQLAAENALKSGNENDALQLLEQQSAVEASLGGLQTAYNTAKTNSDNMKKMATKLAHDIQELEAKQSTIKATMANAKAQQTVNKAMSRVDSDKGISAFERMESKAQKMLDQAQAEAQLNDAFENNDADNLMDKYSTPTSDAQDKLAQMKQRMGL